MKEYDLHGFKREEARNFVEDLIGKIRLDEKPDIIKIITGRGVIRKDLIAYFKKHHIDYFFEPGNDGAMIVEID